MIASSALVYLRLKSTKCRFFWYHSRSDDGHTSVNKTTKMTGKGHRYFVNMFLGGET